MTDALTALCPLDGRYQKIGAKLAKYFSEQALILYRLRVMHRWLVTLVEQTGVPTPKLTNEQYEKLVSLGDSLEAGDCMIVKRIETEGYGAYKRTNHDVKACEFYLRILLEDEGLGVLGEWVHFGCTSEDVNNVAYMLMLYRGVSILVDSATGISEHIAIMSSDHAGLAMLARTHGQPATPTTFGKEMSVFERRIDLLVARIMDMRISVKWNGASGNYNAATVALPHIAWQTLAERFCTTIVEKGERIDFNTHTTQIEPHDSYAELFDLLTQLNTVLIGFGQDIWRYVSDDWLVQKAVEGEVGSSAMPHKVNPIDFENAEGNLGIANALLGHMARKLPISRLQRDLSDSTVERNFGMAFGYCLLGYEALLRGLRKLSPNEAKISAALAEHPEVLTEAYQTILRSVNYPNAYDALKGLARGRKITLNDLHEFVYSLDADVPESAKQRMLKLTPENYLGIAPELARQKLFT